MYTTRKEYTDDDILYCKNICLPPSNIDICLLILLFIPLFLLEKNKTILSGAKVEKASAKVELHNK